MAAQFRPAGARPLLSLRPAQGAPTLPNQQGVVAGDQQQPFVWKDGKRMTPDEIASKNKVAEALMASGRDFSPVQHWSQGLNRVAQALLGAFEARDAKRAEQANIGHSQEVMAGLSQAGSQPTLDAAMRASSDPYASPEVQKLGQFWLERLVPKQSTAQPYRWTDNAGNVWERDPATGQNKLMFVDQAPKQMVANGQLITSTNPYVQNTQTGVPTAPAATPQPGEIVDDPRRANAGGDAGNGVGTFRR